VLIAAAAAAGEVEAEYRRCPCCHLPTTTSSCNATSLRWAARSFLQHSAVTAPQGDDDICVRASSVFAVFLQKSDSNTLLFLMTLCTVWRKEIV